MTKITECQKRTPSQNCCCCLMARISDDRMHEIMQRDPDFLEWMLERASETEAA